MTHSINLNRLQNRLPSKYVRKQCVRFSEFIQTTGHKLPEFVSEKNKVDRYGKQFGVGKVEMDLSGH